MICTMKQSLKLLKVESSGLEELNNLHIHNKTEEELLHEFQNITDLSAKISYLKKFLEKDPTGFEEIKRQLANLVKGSEPEFACKLVLSACKSTYLESINYLAFAEIAIENKAWLIAKEALEVATWLLAETEQSNTKKRIEELSEIVLNKINSNAEDSSKSEFWINKTLDKFPILLKLFNSSNFEKLYSYSFGLLKTSPRNIKNFEVVYKILALTEDKIAINKFIEFVQENISNKAAKDLYTGMAYYLVSDFNKSIDYVNNFLNEFPTSQHGMFYLALNYLMLNKEEDFLETCKKIIPGSNVSFIAIYFISCAISNLELDKKEFPGQKNISHEIRMIIDKLLKIGQKDFVLHILNRFKTLGYQDVLPYLIPNLAELFIESNNYKYAKNLLEDCTDIEVHRLKAWIYRLEGNEKLAEEELIKYRHAWTPEKAGGIGVQLINLNMPEVHTDSIDSIFKSLEDGYNQTSELINKLSIEYGLNNMTCIEAKCADCCKKTYPVVTYPEYFYMRTWLDNQPEEYRTEIYNKSKQILNAYKEKYNKEPPFVFGDLKSVKKNYPRDFQFPCPYLGNDMCTVHPVRPFGCRAYGYGSEDGARYQSCEYYFQQVKGASQLTKTRKAINTESFYKFANKASEKLIGKRVAAPLFVWFAQNHEETLTKINQLVSIS